LCGRKIISLNKRDYAFAKANHAMSHYPSVALFEEYEIPIRESTLRLLIEVTEEAKKRILI